MPDLSSARQRTSLAMVAALLATLVVPTLTGTADARPAEAEVRIVEAPAAGTSGRPFGRVTVEVTGVNGNREPVVTLSLRRADGTTVPGGFSPAASTTTIDGAATFPSLVLGGPATVPAARGYAIVATASLNNRVIGSSPASGPITVWAATAVCDRNGCPPARASRGTTVAQVALSGEGAQGTQSIAIIDEDPYELAGPNCAGDHPRLPDTVLFDTEVDSATGTATVTVRFDRSASPGIARYGLCYLTPAGKNPHGWAPIADPFGDFAFAGLLPACSPSTPAPCIESRSSLGTTAAVPLGEIVVRVPAGDPMFR